MITLFSMPKAFTRETAILQDNAIGSWKRLGGDLEIVLLGDDSGVAEAAARHDVRHEPTVARNERGTPVLSDVFARMNAAARYPILAFVNADIVLMSDFRAAVRATARQRERFLVVSSRFNCRLMHALSFYPGWDDALRTRARAENRMYAAAGSDIFVYPRGLFGAVPAFAIGRGYWDNWLMTSARRRGASLIDATAAITAVHQDHGYGHVSGLADHASDDREVYDSSEGRRNLDLAGGNRALYTAFDATEILTADGRLLSTWRPHLAPRRCKAWLRREVRARLDIPNPLATN